MEEINRIAKLYYKSCIDLRLFGCKGFVFIIAGCPFMMFSMFIALRFNQLKIDFNALIIITQLIGMLFWLKSKNIYNKNLIKRLQLVTHDKTNELKVQKILYLSSLTSKIGSSFFEVLKNMIAIQEINNKNRSVSPDHFVHHFSFFIYDPDSKNRILSLLIYLISLIALLTVVKVESTVNIYSIIDEINLNGILLFFGWTAFFIIFVYIIFMLPIMMAFGYIISPVMRSFSNQKFLLSYLMSELSKYAFSDQQLIAGSENNSHIE